MPVVVKVSNNWDHHSNISQIFYYLWNSLCCPIIIYSYPHYLTPSHSKLFDLHSRRKHISRWSVCHRLNHYRSISTNLDISYHYRNCFSSLHKKYLQIKYVSILSIFLAKARVLFTPISILQR
jgi:hypothetical protein